MKRRCTREFDTAAMRLFGKRSAMKSVSDPHPQPSSSTLLAVAKARTFDGQREHGVFGVLRGWTRRSGHHAQLYFRRGPSTASKNAAGTS